MIPTTPTTPTTNRGGGFPAPESQPDQKSLLKRTPARTWNKLSKPARHALAAIDLGNAANQTIWSCNLHHTARIINIITDDLPAVLAELRDAKVIDYYYISSPDGRVSIIISRWQHRAKLHATLANTLVPHETHKECAA